ncbi:MAG: YceI family protein, partial [Bacteroidia bacterium]
STAVAIVLMSFTLLPPYNWKVKTDAVKINFSMPKEPHGTGSITGAGLNAEIAMIDDVKSKEGEVVPDAKIKAIVDVKSLTTPKPGLTNHLMSPDFFDAEKFPKMTFTSTGIKGIVKNVMNGNYVAEGTLNIKDSTKNVSIPFTFENKDKEGILKGTLEIFAGDYGIMKKSAEGNDKVVITIEVPVTRD